MHELKPDNSVVPKTSEFIKQIADLPLQRELVGAGDRPVLILGEWHQAALWVHAQSRV